MIHLIVPDIHAHPEFDNNRADYLANLIIDLRPDVVINLGDQFDMPSLSGYDKGKRSFVGRSYRADIDAGLEFHDRLWSPVRATKKKLPWRIFLEGNHEHRIEKALDLNPELEGTIGFDDYELEKHYDEVIRYRGGTPGLVEVDGIHYAHFFVSGVLGRAISGEHPAYSLVTKLGRSSVVGHSHVLDVCARTKVDGSKTYGLVAGCYFDYDNGWAGTANDLYWRGVSVLRNVHDGEFDLELISMDQLKSEYA